MIEEGFGQHHQWIVHYLASSNLSPSWTTTCHGTDKHANTVDGSGSTLPKWQW